MNKFVTRFKIPDILTEIVEGIDQGNAILKINNNFLDFKILNNNIPSLSKNVEKLEALLAQFDVPFHCIVLTETWQIDNINLYKISGYDVIYNKSRFNQNDGTVLYIKNDIDYTYHIDTINKVSVINISMTISRYSINIVCVYKPPPIKPNEFIIDLYNYMGSQKLESNYKFIIGNLNIDILKRNQVASEYLKMLSEFNYRTIINKYTRVDRYSKSCIDHIFLSAKAQNIKEKILPLVIDLGITDHYPLILQVVLDNLDMNVHLPLLIISF